MTDKNTVIALFQDHVPEMPTEIIHLIADAHQEIEIHTREYDLRAFTDVYYNLSPLVFDYIETHQLAHSLEWYQFNSPVKDLMDYYNYWAEQEMRTLSLPMFIHFWDILSSHFEYGDLDDFYEPVSEVLEPEALETLNDLTTPYGEIMSIMETYHSLREMVPTAYFDCYFEARLEFE